MKNAAFLCFLWFGLVQSLFPQALHVEILGNKGAFELRVNHQPFFIKGVVAGSRFKFAAQCGANSIRTYGGRKGLDSALVNGMTALYGLSIPGERDGMDWNDKKRVARLKKETLEQVKKLKDHPALLIWALGNELDWIPPGKPYNRKLWDVLNDLAKSIHKIDPNHPVMTVIGTSDMPQKIVEIEKQCPNLDLIGLNAYADLGEKIKQISVHYSKPLVVTEWGPDGHWERPKTTWKVPLEQNSSEKANSYRKRYQEDILGNPGFCLGSYVFYWHHKQEITHTWYGMFDAQGRYTETVAAMCEAWKKIPMDDFIPRFGKIEMKGYSDVQNIRVKVGENLGMYCVIDPKSPQFKTYFDVRREVIPAAYAGQGEKPGAIITPATLIADEKNWSFKAPLQVGQYRVFIYSYDENAGKFAVGNLPFLVE